VIHDGTLNATDHNQGKMFVLNPESGFRAIILWYDPGDPTHKLNRPLSANQRARDYSKVRASSDNTQDQFYDIWHGTRGFKM
jgi:hypothetical protein